MPNIPCPLDVAAREHGSKAAVMWGARRISFLQLNQFVNTTVKAFKERNLKAGSRVGLVAENTVEAVIVILSLWRLGALACVINPRFPNSKIATLLKKVKASAVVIDQPGALHGIQLGISKVLITDLIVFDVKDSFYKNDTTAFLTMDTQQEAAVIFTSGTAGEAKAAVLTYGNLYYNALGSNEVIRLSPGDRWILSLPLYHVSGLGVLMRSLIAGATVVITRQEDLLKRLTDGKTTHVSLVPTQLFRLLNDKHLAQGTLKAILLGGSAIPQSLVEESVRRHLPLYVSYGLTEMASQVATGEMKKAGELCAKALPQRELTIKDGEICVRGAVLFNGYLDGDKMTRPLDSDGWFHTGDLGALDQNGCLQVFGRRDNMFISGGENIHPEEIEGVLMRIDGIAQAVVVPKEDKEFGCRPVAFIQWNAEGHLKTGDALVKFLTGELPKFKVPAAFYPWPDSVKEGIKPDRKMLTALAAAQRGGFTLLELLVVIIIVGVLASVAMPALSRNIERSRAVEALNAIGIIKRAVEVCNYTVRDYCACSITIAPANAPPWDLLALTDPALDGGAHFIYQGGSCSWDRSYSIVATRNTLDNGDGASAITMMVDNQAGTLTKVGTGVFQGIN